MSPSKSIVINVPPLSSMNMPAESVGGAAPTVVSDMTTPPAMAIEELQLKSKKRVNVTVTVLSIAGLFVKDGAAKKRSLSLTKKFSSRGNSVNEAAPEMDTSSRTAATSTSMSSATSASNNDSAAAATTIVASFSRVVNTKDGKPRTVMTHLPSLPLPFPSTSAPGRAVKCDTMNSVVHWPESNQDIASIPNNENAASGRVLSSYQFQHTFQREPQGTAAASSPEDTPDRFVPQPLSIQIAISRSGRMFKLGTADILLSGEETAESSINVPIKNTNPAIPKSSTTSKKAFKNRPKSSTGDKMIPMMKLKGDTLKCGLDPNATLRVLVHVSKPIGETMEISPNLTVTMISKTNTPKPPSSQVNAAQAPKIEQQPSEVVSWEYNPTLAAVVVKNPKKEDVVVPTTNETTAKDTEQMVRVLTLQDDTVHVDDEPSCSSSAYMSDFGYHSRYPSKGLSTARSHSTESTMTASSGSTEFSDLTDSRSWLSQTGIEVIPFTPDRSPSQIHIPANSRLRSLDSEGFTVDESRNTSLLDEDTEHGGSTTAFHNRDEKKKSWKQRFSCSLPICGSSFNRNGDAEEDILSVLHEEDDDVISVEKYGIAGRCGDFGSGNPMEIQPSYYTEDGDDDEDDASTDGEEEGYHNDGEDGYVSNAASSAISL